MAIRFILPALAAALLALAPARADEAVSRSPAAAYRAYALEQAEMLVRFTRMLATDIRDGNVQAAQNDFASTHRYLERIRPLVRQLPDLERQMDASDDAVGFRRIERALYVAHSTDGLAPVADQLNADARELKAQAATLPIGFDLLADGPSDEIERVSARVLGGDDQPYAKSGLWDLEAGLDGARAMVAVATPRDPLLANRIATAFDDAGKALATVSEGCGYKSFDSLSDADKGRLRETTATLARELAKLKTRTAMD